MKHEEFVAKGFNNSVAEALEGRGITEAKLSHMSEDDIFREFLEWNGVIGFATMIRNGLDNIRNALAISHD